MPEIIAHSHHEENISGYENICTDSQAPNSFRFQLILGTSYPKKRNDLKDKRRWRISYYLLR